MTVAKLTKLFQSAPQNAPVLMEEGDNGDLCEVQDFLVVWVHVTSGRYPIYSRCSSGPCGLCKNGERKMKVVML